MTIYVFHYSSNYYLLLNNTRRSTCFTIHQTTIYYLIIHDDLRVSLFIKLLFLDNSNAFSFLIIIHQALWPNG